MNAAVMTELLPECGSNDRASPKSKVIKVVRNGGAVRDASSTGPGGQRGL